MFRVNSYKANYRHSTVQVQVITLWTNTTQIRREITRKHWRKKHINEKTNKDEER
jgi:hypothetical protein